MSFKYIFKQVNKTKPYVCNKYKNTYRKVKH